MHMCGLHELFERLFYVLITLDFQWQFFTRRAENSFSFIEKNGRAISLRYRQRRRKHLNWSRRSDRVLFHLWFLFLVSNRVLRSIYHLKNTVFRSHNLYLTKRPFKIFPERNKNETIDPSSTFFRRGLFRSVQTITANTYWSLMRVSRQKWELWTW